MQLIYNVKFDSIAQYAAPLRAGPLFHTAADKLLLRGQGLALLQVTRAYRTVSRPALCIISQSTTTGPSSRKVMQAGSVVEIQIYVLAGIRQALQTVANLYNTLCPLSAP